MFVFLFVLVGVLLAMGALCVLWLIPDEKLGRGPRLMMVLFAGALFVFLLWVFFFARHAAPQPMPMP